VQTSEHKLMQPQQHAGKRIHYSRLVVYDIKMFDTEFKKKNLLDIISVPKAAIEYSTCYALRLHVT